MTQAGQWRRLDAATARQLIASLREYDRVITPAELNGLAARFGWGTSPSPSGKQAYIGDGAAFLNGPWDLGGYEAQVLFQPDGVRWISVLLTERVADADPQARLFLQDAFAEYLTLAGDLLGPPTRRESGDVQECRWRGTATTVAIVHAGVTITVDLAANAYYDDRDNSIEMDS